MTEQQQEVKPQFEPKSLAKALLANPALEAGGTGCGLNSSLPDMWVEINHSLSWSLHFLTCESKMNGPLSETVKHWDFRGSPVSQCKGHGLNPWLET